MADQKEYIIVKEINGIRYYLSEIVRIRESKSATDVRIRVYHDRAGNWTRKRKKAYVFGSDKEMLHSKRLTDPVEYVERLLYGMRRIPETWMTRNKNRHHVYYGRSFNALRLVRWFYNLYGNKTEGACKLSIVDLNGNRITWWRSFSIDLADFEPFVRKKKFPY